MPVLFSYRPWLLLLTLFWLGAVPAEPPAADEEAYMLRMVNYIRSRGCRCGDTFYPPAPLLRLHDQLTLTARVHARDMATHEFMGHEGSDGSRVGIRARRSGYPWRQIGENVAWGYPTVKEVVLGWRHSPGHCQTMMSRKYNEFGAARQGTYWVQVFGRR